jgi:hypothetical protein
MLQIKNLFSTIINPFVHFQIIGTSNDHVAFTKHPAIELLYVSFTDPWLAAKVSNSGKIEVRPQQ